MHQEEFGWSNFRAARKLGPGDLIPFGFGSSMGGLLWLTKNRSTTTSGLKKKWDRHSCLSPNISVSFALRRESVLGEQMHGHLA